MMIALVISVSCVVAAPPAERPAAMVLDLRGQVELVKPDGQSQPAKLGDLVYPGEILRVPSSGSATLAIMGAGAQEQLKPGTEATIKPGGCTPPESVAQRIEQKPAVAKALKSVKPAPGDGRKAAVSMREVSDRPQAITPVDQSLLSSDRPDLAWPPMPEAKAYRVSMVIEGSQRTLWVAETEAPKYAYPSGKPALERGKAYRWEVTTQDRRPVVAGRFLVASESELQQIEELHSLTSTPDRANLLLAALGYQRLGCYSEAIGIYEKLAKQDPHEPLYQEALAKLYRKAGRGDEATVLEKSAQK